MLEKLAEICAVEEKERKVKSPKSFPNKFSIIPNKFQSQNRLLLVGPFETIAVSSPGPTERREKYISGSSSSRLYLPVYPQNLTFSFSH